MIRQPDFVTAEFAQDIIESSFKKKREELFKEVKFAVYEEGHCIQMLHMGSFDSEPESFKIMEKFSRENGLKRLFKQHREIYLSDARRVIPARCRTVLRFKVGEQD